MGDARFNNVKLSTPARDIKEHLGLAADAFTWRQLLQLSQESCNVLMNAVYVPGSQYPTFSRIEHAKLTEALQDFYARVRRAGFHTYVDESRPTIARWFLYQRYWVRKGGLSAATVEDEAPAADAAEEVTGTTEPATDTATSPQYPLASTYASPSPSTAQYPPDQQGIYPSTAEAASPRAYPPTSVGYPYQPYPPSTYATSEALYHQPAPAVDPFHPSQSTLGSGQPAPFSLPAILNEPPPPTLSSPSIQPYPPSERWDTHPESAGSPSYFAYFVDGVYKYSTYWTEFQDPSGKLYYYNYATRETSWTPPDDGRYKPLNAQ